MTDRAAFGATLLLGLLIALLALPQLAAALLALPADPVVFALRSGQRVSDEALLVLERSRAASAGWYPTAAVHRERSAAALLLAGRRPPGDPSEAGGHRAAAEAARAALARAPVDPQGWALLARLAWERDGDAGRARDLLRASFWTGPYQPALTPARVRLVLALWPTLGPADRAAFAGEIRHLWRDRPERLAALALAGEDLLVIAGALDAPGAVAELIRLRRALLEGQGAPAGVPAQGPGLAARQGRSSRAGSRPGSRGRA